MFIVVTMGAALWNAGSMRDVAMMTSVLIDIRRMHHMLNAVTLRIAVRIYIIVAYV